jgi:hypothetical protein
MLLNPQTAISPRWQPCDEYQRDKPSQETVR